MDGRRTVTESEVIDQLRLPLIVLVTYAHSYSGEVAGHWLRLLAGQTLSKLAVPVFFLMSGYLFFRHLETWDWGVYRQKLRRRLMTLLLPYVAWNLLMAVKLGTFDWRMFWVYWPTCGMQTDWLGQANWMTAPANLPLWFLRDLMVMTLVAPIIYKVFSQRRWRRPLIVAIVLVYLSGIGAFAVPGLSMYAVCFFSLGAYIRLSGSGLLAVALRLRWLSLTVSVVLAVAMLLTYGTPPFSSLMLAFRLTGALAVFALAHSLLTHTGRRLPKLVCDASYFVYLAHFVFFMFPIDRAFLWLDGGRLTTTHYLLAPLLKATLLVLIYVTFRYIKERNRPILLTVCEKMRTFVGRKPLKP